MTKPVLGNRRKITMPDGTQKYVIMVKKGSDFSRGCYYMYRGHFHDVIPESLVMEKNGYEFWKVRSWHRGKSWV